MTTTFEKAVEAYESKDFGKAYALFEQESEINLKALLNLGMMNLKGFGCEKNETIAVELFEKAAEKEDMQALGIMATFYEKGTYVPQNKEKALEYYVKAANIGDVNAQLKAGMIFKEEGKNLEAMQYLITAAHNNNAQAQSIITYVSNSELATEKNDIFHNFEPIKQRALVENLIETKIKPTLEVDNGGIELLNYIPGERPQVWLNYLGACSGCHLGSTSTADMLLDHFETMIDKNVVLYLM